MFSSFFASQYKIVDCNIIRKRQWLSHLGGVNELGLDNFLCKSFQSGFILCHWEVISEFCDQQTSNKVPNLSNVGESLKHKA